MKLPKRFFFLKTSVLRWLLILLIGILLIPFSHCAPKGFQKAILGGNISSTYKKDASLTLNHVTDKSFRTGRRNDKFLNMFRQPIIETNYIYNIRDADDKKPPMIDKNRRGVIRKRINNSPMTVINVHLDKVNGSSSTKNRSMIKVLKKLKKTDRKILPKQSTDFEKRQRKQSLLSSSNKPYIVKWQGNKKVKGGGSQIQFSIGDINDILRGIKMEKKIRSSFKGEKMDKQQEKKTSVTVNQKSKLFSKWRRNQLTGLLEEVSSLEEKRSLNEDAKKQKSKLAKVILDQIKQKINKRFGMLPFRVKKDKLKRDLGITNRNNILSSFSKTFESKIPMLNSLNSPSESLRSYVVQSVEENLPTSQAGTEVKLTKKPHKLSDEQIELMRKLLRKATVTSRKQEIHKPHMKFKANGRVSKIEQVVEPSLSARHDEDGHEQKNFLELGSVGNGVIDGKIEGKDSRRFKEMRKVEDGGEQNNKTVPILSNYDGKNSLEEEMGKSGVITAKEDQNWIGKFIFNGLPTSLQVFKAPYNLLTHWKHNDKKQFLPKSVSAVSGFQSFIRSFW